MPIFDTVADEYDDARASCPPAVYESLGDLDGLCVLDVRAGTGIAIRQPVERGARVVAVDPGRTVLTRAVARAPRLPAVVADATHLKAGVPIKVVSERLGHASPAFTMSIYQHVLPGMQRDAADTFGANAGMGPLVSALLTRACWFPGTSTGATSGIVGSDRRRCALTATLPLGR